MRRRQGFTLLELLVTVVVTLIVGTAATSFYIDLSRYSQAASEVTRDARHATAVLDRVCRDIEAAMLMVRPEGTDPLEHPWLFLGEGGGGEGADRLKFVTRGRYPRTTEASVSDLEMVSFLTRADFDGRLELYRWSSPRLPESLDRRLASPDAEGSFLLADGLASFSVRFLDSEGAWVEAWDSSQLVQSDQLPTAAEVTVWLDPGPDDEFREPIGPFSRRVVLPLRPIDLAAQIDPDGAGGDGEDEDDEEGDDDELADDDEEGCRTIAQCLNTGAANTANSALLDPALLGQCVGSVAIPPQFLKPECR